VIGVGRGARRRGGDFRKDDVLGIGALSIGVTRWTKLIQKNGRACRLDKGLKSSSRYIASGEIERMSE